MTSGPVLQQIRQDAVEQNNEAGEGDSRSLYVPKGQARQGDSPVAEKKPGAQGVLPSPATGEDSAKTVRTVSPTDK